MKLLEFVFMAIRDINNNRVRSFLTSLGVVVGVAAIIALVSLTKGLRNAILEELLKSEADVIQIFPGGAIALGHMAEEQVGLAKTVGKLTDKDVKIIEAVDGVEIVSKQIGELLIASKKQPKVYYGDEVLEISVIGIEPEKFLEITRRKVYEGRFLNEKDKYSCVIGWEVAKNEFSKEIELKKKIKIENYTCKVVGILEKEGNPITGYDKAILIPLSFAKEIYNKGDYSSIYVKVKKDYNVEDVAEEIDKELMKNHKVKEDNKDYIIITPNILKNIVDSILTILSIFLGGIASISLIVAGIGIMNTMLITVTEKTREIGIMKAVGATNSDVLLIFLIHSALIGLIGGIVGIVFGYGLAKLIGIIGLLMPEHIYINPSLDGITVGIAIIFSTLIGIVSGYYPSRKASLLNPIDALRYE